MLNNVDKFEIDKTIWDLFIEINETHKMQGCGQVLYNTQELYMIKRVKKYM